MFCKYSNSVLKTTSIANGSPTTSSLALQVGVRSPTTSSLAIQVGVQLSHVFQDDLGLLYRALVRCKHLPRRLHPSATPSCGNLCRFAGGVHLLPLYLYISFPIRHILSL